MRSLFDPQNLILLGAVLALAGCADRDERELQQWMESVRSAATVKVQEIPAPKQFVPFSYTAKAELDPYNPTKMTVALAKSETQSNDGVRPDLERRKEALENFPLDSIKMVGTLAQAGTTYALLQVDKVLFQAKAGNYVGQNFGLITKVTDSSVELKEIVRNAAGDWMEQPAKLELQESTK